MKECLLRLSLLSRLLVESLLPDPRTLRDKKAVARPGRREPHKSSRRDLSLQWVTDPDSRDPARLCQSRKGDHIRAP